jgi:hypothetical protein
MLRALQDAVRATSTRWLASSCVSTRARRDQTYRLLVRPCIFALSAGYLGANLDTREISVLEAQDLGIASDLFKNYALSADHSPLHFMFVNVWQRLNDTSVAFLRAPSVLFCALSAVVVFSLTERLAGTMAGALAAFFLATNPEVVDAARSTRLYSLFILGSASCAWFAHAYLTASKHRDRLFGFAAAIVATVYTHLFAWLMTPSILLLFGIDLFRHWRDVDLRARKLKCLAVVGLILVPQVIHGVVASQLVHTRHALYSGISAAPTTFLATVTRTLFLGELEGAVPVHSYVLLAPLTLFVLGIFVLKGRGAAAAAAIFLPALVGAWLLSRSSQVEARYLCFLTPVIAIFMGIGAARAPKAEYFAPLALTVFWLFHFATANSYWVAPTDWYDLAARLDRTREPGDVIAVFPGYFVSSFRRYSSAQEFVPVTFPADLQRVLARGRRVLLVVNNARYFGNIEAELAANARSRELFESTVREPLRVLSVSVKRREMSHRIGSDPDSILVAGIVGSGGFPWQADIGSPRPFARLTKLFASSRLVVADYEAYHPTWFARLLLGPEQSRQLVPSEENVRTLKRAGINAVFIGGDDAISPADAGLLDSGGLRPIQQRRGTAVSKPSLFKLGHLTVGFLAVDVDSIRANGNVTSPQIDRALSDARATVGGDGRLVAVFRSAPDYARLPSAFERRVARRLIDGGVDVVLGEGGYAAKEVEAYAHGVIAYGLGTLLRPPLLSLAMRESTGLAVRLNFRESGTPRYSAFPLTFDDSDEAALADPALLPTPLSPSLVDELSSADASYVSEAGASHPLNNFRDVGACLQPWQQRLFDQTSAVTRWFPETPPETPLRPFARGFCDGDAYAAERGVLSLGEFRRTIELGGSRAAAIQLKFQRVELGNELELTFGIPDDRLLSKFLPLHDEAISLEIGNAPPSILNLPYRAGWRQVSIDTSSMRGTEQTIDITLRTNGTHFPVAVDLRVLGESH